MYLQQDMNDILDGELDENVLDFPSAETSEKSPACECSGWGRGHLQGAAAKRSGGEGG